MKHQFEGECTGINKRVRFDYKTGKNLDPVIESSIAFKLNNTEGCVITIEGHYELGTKFLVDVYPIPAFKE